jgi:hypothetical protein
MDETKRLRLIAEAVKYCQRVKNKKVGMPHNCYTKALREPVHFLWERRVGASPPHISGPKDCAAIFRSQAAKGLTFGKDQIVYDHAIPFKYLEDRLVNLRHVSIDLIRKLLKKFCVPVIVTKDEHRRLSRNHQSGMPKDWNGVDPRARYKAAGIKTVKNKMYLKLNP